MKKLNTILILCIFSLIYLNTRCKENENCHRSVTIINNEANAIYYYLGFSYPDTNLNYNPTNNSYYKVEKQSQSVGHYGRCLEGDYSYTSKLMCFIYDARILETTPWDTVSKNYLVLKRYDLSLQDLENMNWTITYP